jgi:serine/threonine-protein kinase
VGPVETAAELLTAALEGEPTLNEARYSLARAWATIGRWDHAATTLGPTPTDYREVVPFMLHRTRFLLWEGNLAALDAVARELPQLAALFGPAELRAVDALLTVGRHRVVAAREHEVLRTLFPTDAKTTQRRAAFNAQIRAEMYLAGRDTDAALRAMMEADANGLIDLTWLDRCPLLDEVREHSTFANVRRATEIRAARIRDALDAHR